MKRVVWITLSVLIVGGVAGGVGYGLAKRGNLGGEKIGVEVRTEGVSRGDLVEIVSAPGQVEPRVKVQISAKISARITELPFKEGDSITKGDPVKGVLASVLLRLDNSDLAASLKATEARYAAQQASLEVAEVRIKSALANIETQKVLLADANRDLRRQLTLFETSDVSQVTVDSAQVKVDQFKSQIVGLERSVDADRANLVVLKHELEAADAQIAQAREQLSYTVISSPLDGTVTRVNAKEGELVVTGTMNNAGTVIMEVADLSRMLVVGRVDEASIAGLKVGQRASARSTAYPGKVFTGTVTLVALSKTTQQQAQQRGDPTDGQPYYKCEIILDEGSQVLPGVSADVEVETMRHEKVLRVPSQAVLGRPLDELSESARAAATVDRSRSIATVVFVLRGGKAVAVPVKIGPSDLTHTMVESGVDEKDVVITGPYKALEALKDGDAVKLQNAGPATAPTTKPN